MRILAALVLQFLLRLTPGYASSNGLGGVCFADALKLCTLDCPNDIPRPWATKNQAGTLSPCCPLGMDMVSPPTHSSSYSLTAPSSRYNPGSIVTLSLDVLNKDAKYLGLLLYAVQTDGREIRVGTWSFPEGGDQKFWTPPGCDKKTVVHKDAGVKHIHHTFDFVAPPVGTGKIRFRVLIKHGETNGGSFYWPKADLVLKEGQSKASPIWIRGDLEQSCSAACASKGLSCEKDAMNVAISLRGKEQFDAASKFTSCQRPHINNNGKSCGLSNLPLVSSDNGFCFHRDDGLCPLLDVCGAKTAINRRRVCACTDLSTTTTATATTTVTTVTTDSNPNPNTSKTSNSNTDPNSSDSSTTTRIPEVESRISDSAIHHMLSCFMVITIVIVL